MKKRYWTLRCWTAPLVVLLPLMPLMDFHAEQIPVWFKGTSFLTLVAQLLSTLLSGVAGAVISALFGGTAA